MERTAQASVSAAQAGPGAAAAGGADDRLLAAGYGAEGYGGDGGRGGSGPGEKQAEEFRFVSFLIAVIADWWCVGVVRQHSLYST